MNILIITPTLPYPPDDGARIRLFNLIKRASQKHSITLLSLIWSYDETRYVPALSKYCSLVETVVGHTRSRWGKILALMHGLFSGEPPESRLALNREMGEKMQALLAARHFDIVQIEHTFMASYLKMIPASSSAKRIISIIDIGSRQYRRMFKIEKRFLTKIRWYANWLMMKTWEVRVLGEFDKGIAVSSLDKQFLKRIKPGLDISVIDNGIDVEHCRPLPSNIEKKNILFLGLMYYEANSDAALYFCSKILPLIKQQIAKCRFFIVGKNPSQELRGLADGESVFVTGYVDDPVTYYQNCDVTVVPLRAGGGTRLKILEAMALGRPVVSTSIGCEGLELIDGQHILVADNPEKFAKKTIQLLTDELLYHRLVYEARKLVEAKYSWDSISENLLNIYSDLSH